MSLSPGTRLGPYGTQSPVGAGGMGAVYKPRDTRLDRTVAIKILPPTVSVVSGGSLEEVRMRKFLCLIVLVFFAAAAAAQTKPAAPQTKPHAAAKAGTDVASVQKAIEAANAKAMEAMAKGDAKGVMANYAEDAIVLMPGAPMWKGHAAIVKALQEFMDSMTIKDPKSHTEDVMVAGNLAVETGTFDWTVQPKDGAAFHDTGKYLTVWEHQPDGTWKVIRDINNSDQPPK